MKRFPILNPTFFFRPLLYDGALGEMFHEEGRDCGAFVWMDDHFVVGDKECGHNGTGGICKQDKRPTDVFCKPGWYLYQGICYKLIDYQGTRSQMKQRCKQTGGRLATPKDYGVFVSDANQKYLIIYSLRPAQNFARPRIFFKMSL